MEWLLIVLTLSGYSSSSFSEGRHPSQQACSDAGKLVVVDLNLLEQKREKERTTVYSNGDTVVAYSAKKWEFICTQVPKK